MVRWANGELDDLWDIEVRPDTEQWNWIVMLLSKNRFQRVVSELRRLQEILRKYAFFANLAPATRQLVATATLDVWAGPRGNWQRRPKSARAPSRA